MRNTVILCYYISSIIVADLSHILRVLSYYRKYGNIMLFTQVINLLLWVISN